ncbi:hypothetical protein NW762_011064 [Fusarium torreyae]|uniref:Uncharacterized protein n=1 Tax=Fusarium torreyae TaxID=1237075 RepID=A0A9W8RSU2_9HYPO|nr:hypothetical protein NW762_011064 [Fusarium torreyae]
MGILPWWYRVYYLHIAGTIFLAAMLKPDLYTNEVQRCWDDFISALRQHEHLSLYVSQCVQNFTTLSTRILGARRLDFDMSTATVEQVGDPAFTNAFQDIGINLDEFLFDIEGMIYDESCNGQNVFNRST